MIRQVISTILFSLGVGFVLQVTQAGLESTYLNQFLSQNLINLLVAVLAVNSATMGIVLTKIRDLVEKKGHGNLFNGTKQQMLLAIKEQVALIIAAVILLTLSESKYLAGTPNLHIVFDAAICAVFTYAITILYDTAKSVLIIIDVDVDAETSD